MNTLPSSDRELATTMPILSALLRKHGLWRQPDSLRSFLHNAAWTKTVACLARARALVIPLAALALSQLVSADVAVQSYWQLGEGATVGADVSSANDGTTNNISNSTGTTILTASPSGVAGSTSYARTSGVNYQGLWMFGAGSTAQTVPSDDWGVQFNVRIPTLPASGTYKAVFGMAEGVPRPPGGLVIEANNVGGTVYWDVNKQGIANYIIPRNALVTVAANTWYNLALVKSGGTTSFYVNGALAGSNAGAINTSGLLAFGFEQNVGTHQLAGDFDEARFFTFAPGAFTPADLGIYALTYDGNGSDGGEVPVDSGSPYYSGTQVSVANEGTMVRDGYVFTGWNTLSDGNGTSYSPTATINITSNTTLYAQWVLPVATITSEGGFPDAISTTYGMESLSTSVVVSGVNLTNDITATAPAGLEVSTDDVTFGPTAIFIQSGGNAGGTLYVRLKNNAPVSGSPYDNVAVTLTSPGALSVNVATTSSDNTVTPKALTVTGAAALDKMYDGTTTGTVVGTLLPAEPFGSGGSGDGTPYLGDTLTVSAPGTFADSAVGGPYAVTPGTFSLGGSSAGNYTLTQPTGLTLSASILDTATWTQATGGSWTDTANWLNNVVGTGAGNIADFSTLDLTATTTVTLSGPQTIGGLLFGDTTPNNNWVVGGSTLTLAATITPIIDVSNQTATISSALASANGLGKTGEGTLTLGSIASGTVDMAVDNGTLNLAAAALNTSWNNPGGLANGGTLTVNTGATLQISSPYNIGYQQTVNINGGTLNLANNSTGDGQNYTLNLNFTGGGTIFSSTASSLRWGELADATITVNGTTPATISSILRMIPGNSRTGTINIVDAAGILNFTGNIIDYPGIPGGVPMNKSGAGTVVLAGANNYTSTTAVNDGTLVVDGTLGATAITVASAATLDAGSNIGGNAAFGASVGIDTGGHLRFHVASSPSAQVTRTLTGSLTLASGNMVDLVAASAPADGVYTLLTAGSITGAPESGTTLTLASGRTATLSVSGGNTLVLTIASGGYDAWAAQISNGKTLRTEDADDDGFSNLQEYLFGTDPMAGTGALVDTTASGATLTIRWRQLVNGGTYQLTESATLANPWLPCAVVPADDGPVDGDYQPRMAEIPIGASADFFRVEATEN